MMQTGWVNWKKYETSKKVHLNTMQNLWTIQIRVKGTPLRLKNGQKKKGIIRVIYFRILKFYLHK